MTKKSKKGFTLIELLAVILILGIIALIAVPIVNHIINEAKRGSFKSTVQNIVRTIENKCEEQLLRGEALTETYTFSNTGMSPSLGMKGKLPIGGTITVDNECNTTLYNVTDGTFVATKTSDSLEIALADEKEPKVCRVTQGTGTNIGDIITCGTESFYVYDATGDSIKMLAKYNLKVGGTYNNSTGTYTPYTESELTNKQDVNLKGYVTGQTIYYGTTAFSSSSKKGTEYSTYQGSIVEEYVDRYKEILTNIGVTVEEARLITKEEIEQLVNNGNSLSHGSIKAKVDNLNRAWIYSTTYWTGSASDNNNVWDVASDGGFYRSYYSGGGAIGVRPVVVISKSIL